MKKYVMWVEKEEEERSLIIDLRRHARLAIVELVDVVDVVDSVRAPSVHFENNYHRTTRPATRTPLGFLLCFCALGKQVPSGQAPWQQSTLWNGLRTPRPTHYVCYLPDAKGGHALHVETGGATQQRSILSEICQRRVARIKLRTKCSAHASSSLSGTGLTSSVPSPRCRCRWWRG